MFCRAVVGWTSVNGIEQTEVLKKVPQHDAQIPDIGGIGPASSEDDFRSGECVGLNGVVVLLIAPGGETDVSDFSRGYHSICWRVAEIATRLIYDAAVRVRHLTWGGSGRLILDNTVKDGGIAKAHHNVVGLQIGMNDSTLTVEVVETLEKGWQEFAKVVATKQVARQFLHGQVDGFSQYIVYDAQMLSMRAFESEYVEHEPNVVAAWMVGVSGRQMFSYFSPALQPVFG